MPLVISSVENGNLRGLALAHMDDLGLKCRDVRTHEAGIQDIHHKIKPELVELVRRDYAANEGWETFVSYEDTLQVELSNGNYEFSLSAAEGSTTIQALCREMGTNCMDLSSLVTGRSCCTNKSRTTYYNKYDTQSTSTKNLAQMAQLLRSGRFGKYDYGLLANLANYWTIIPPSYDLQVFPGITLYF